MLTKLTCCHAHFSSSFLLLCITAVAKIKAKKTLASQMKESLRTTLMRHHSSTPMVLHQLRRQDFF